MDADRGSLHIQTVARYRGVSDARQVRRDHRESLASAGIIGVHINEVPRSRVAG